MSNAKKTLRENLKAQLKQIEWHKAQHGKRRSSIEMARGLPEFRDESALIEQWERKAAATKAKLSASSV
jgi:hypothetical protein